MLREVPSRSMRSLTRRRFVLSLASSFGLYGTASALEYPFSPPQPLRLSVPLADVIDLVTPRAGIPTGIVFGDSIQRLIAAGVIDPDEFRALTNELPVWVERVLRGPSDDPIVFNGQTAPHLVNLLWPLGLANRAGFNEKSRLVTPLIPNYASTGGWTLGREQNGYVYFNQIDAIHMTVEQEASVLDVATSTFRPCCDNSTFFQDCNHGSALLGLLQLAASQGVAIDGLYGVALAANSFWFPDYYVKTALYFSHFHRRSWDEVPARFILGAKFSSLTGWQRNVSKRLAQANIWLPGEVKGQQTC